MRSKVFRHSGMGRGKRQTGNPGNLKSIRCFPFSIFTPFYKIHRSEFMKPVVRPYPDLFGTLSHRITLILWITVYMFGHSGRWLTQQIYSQSSLDLGAFIAGELAKPTPVRKRSNQLLWKSPISRKQEFPIWFHNKINVELDACRLNQNRVQLKSQLKKFHCLFGELGFFFKSRQLCPFCPVVKIVRSQWTVERGILAYPIPFSFLPIPPIPEFVVSSPVSNPSVAVGPSISKLSHHQPSWAVGYHRRLLNLEFYQGSGGIYVNVHS